MKKLVIVLALLGTLVGGHWAYNLWWGKPWDIDHFYEVAFAKLLLTQPETLTMLGIIDNTWLDFHSDELSDISPAAERAQLALVREQLATLRRYDMSDQTPQQQLSGEILQWYLQDIVDGEDFLFHDYPINQMSGWPAELPTLFSTYQQVVDRPSAERYIARLEAVQQKIAQGMEGLALRAEIGVLPPRFVFVRVLHDLQALLEVPEQESLFYTSLVEKLAPLDTIGDGERRQLEQSALLAIERGVYPASRELLAYWTLLSEQATDDDGVWKLPNGDAYYAYLLRHFTTADYGPEELHQLGLTEVQRIGSEINQILRQLGREQASIGEALARIGEDPAFRYPVGDVGREQALAEALAAIEEAETTMPAAFKRLPRAAVEVRRVPEFQEQSRAGASYFPPALDGSRPGIFWLNLRAPDQDFTTFDLRTTIFHEAIPGHHFQLALAQEIEGVPSFRKSLPFTAYAEGWGLYAERLAWEFGLQNDPYNNLGRLQAEIWRAVRLVVDTGIHYKRWTRQQAIDYMVANTGLPESTVVTEVERYIVMPGQACAYKVGMLKILELRERSRDILGERFDIRDFHEVVLMNGSLPLGILERVVDDYIEASRAAVVSGDD
jgi:uncharacterized protein (DUF885 family)